MDHLHLYFIGFSVAVGLLSLKNGLTLPLKLFVIFLCYTLANELIALSVKGINHWLYNTYYYIRFPLLSVIYLRLLFMPAFRKIIIGFLISMPLWFVISYYHSGGFNNLHTPTFLAGGVMVVLMSTGYLYELLRNPDEGSLFQKPFFWISTGLLFYFLGILPYMGSVNYIYKIDKNLAKKLYYIIEVLNPVMYTLFVVAFLSTWNRRTSTI